MIEYNEYLDSKYTGKQALQRRIEFICSMRTTDTPYYPIGVDLDLFTYASPEFAIRSALAEYQPSVTITGANARVKTTDITVDVALLTQEGTI